jgi:hypothetical protein
VLVGFERRRNLAQLDVEMVYVSFSRVSADSGGRMLTCPKHSRTF